jgi:hypothetical protein
VISPHFPYGNYQFIIVSPVLCNHDSSASINLPAGDSKSSNARRCSFAVMRGKNQITVAVAGEDKPSDAHIARQFVGMAQPKELPLGSHLARLVATAFDRLS